MTTETLGERMKLYEGLEAGRRLMPLLPALARLDGRAFHTFVKGLERPYDERLSRLMIETATFLVRETAAVIGYTQSDEITLAWTPADYTSQVFFDGRVQKMSSVLAAMAAMYFNIRLPEFLPVEFGKRYPVFDCRVWNVPTLEEAANTFLLRELDATKNSIAMAARRFYTHAELDGQSSAQVQELLWRKGVNWNDYPAFFKRGTYIARRRTARPFSGEEQELLPPKHAARRNPNLCVERAVVAVLELPPLVRVGNRAGVLFGGEEPSEGDANFGVES